MILGLFPCYSLKLLVPFHTLNFPLHLPIFPSFPANAASKGEIVADGEGTTPEQMLQGKPRLLSDQTQQVLKARLLNTSPV